MLKARASGIVCVSSLDSLMNSIFIVARCIPGELPGGKDRHTSSWRDNPAGASPGGGVNPPLRRHGAI